VSVVVREEAPSDREQAIVVEREAFGGSEEAGIVRAVRDLDGSFGLVAEEDDAVVGHVQLSRAWVGSDPVLALGPIGVLPGRQGRGIGSALVRAALAAARDRGEIAVILLGSQAFYPRFGFRSGGSMGLKNPYTGVQEEGFVVAEEDFMVAPLADRASALSGAVRWHPSFGQPVEGDADPR
jgi:putative acetyltransferase